MHPPRDPRGMNPRLAVTMPCNYPFPRRPQSGIFTSYFSRIVFKSQSGHAYPWGMGQAGEEDLSLHPF